jgi:hypothetical protein
VLAVAEANKETYNFYINLVEVFRNQLPEKLPVNLGAIWTRHNEELHQRNKIELRWVYYLKSKNPSFSLQLILIKKLGAN